MAPPVPQPPPFLRRWRHLTLKLISMLWSASMERIREQVLDLAHPFSIRLKRANKWAIWTVCGKCQLRLTYQETEAKKRHRAEKAVSQNKKKKHSGSSGEAMEAQSAQAASQAQNLATLAAVMMKEEVWGEEAEWTLDAPHP